MPIHTKSEIHIHHRTSYRYHQMVRLEPHFLMLRPREGHDLRLLSSELVIFPDSSVTWAQDVFGNSVATVRFDGLTDELTVDSKATIRLSASQWPVFDIAADAISYPFKYTDSDWADLGALTLPQYLDPGRRLHDWARGFVYGTPTDTLALLKDLSAGVSNWVSYQSRYEEGTQSPVQTLDRGSGTCRDYAVLLAEAARVLGFGARIVSGYLHKADPLFPPLRGVDSTHAWAEIYVPGAGWITFDPTNQSIGNSNLIPVAVGRNIGQIMPVVGSFIGAGNVLKNMIVEVHVTSSAA